MSRTVYVNGDYLPEAELPRSLGPGAPEQIEIRGEVFMTKADFAAAYEKEAQEAENTQVSV